MKALFAKHTSGGFARTLIRYWPLLVLLGLMIWQHAYIYLYHDDFGYASLSYLGQLTDGSKVAGNQFSFSQMMTFLKMHYLTWGGRVLPFFFLISMLRWNIWVFRITQSIVLTVTLYLGVKWVEEDDKIKRGHWMNSLVIVALFGLIPIIIQDDGTYWAAASVLYVWPFLWVFASGFLLQRYSVGKMKKGWLALIIFLSFASGFSHEQISFVALFMLLGILVDHLVRRKERSVIIADLLCLFSLGLGFLLLMISPGNQIRTGFEAYQGYYSLTLLDRMKVNLPEVLKMTFSRSNLIIFCFLLLANIITLIPQISRSSKNRWGSLLLAISQGVLLVLFSGMILTALSIVRTSPFGGLFALIDELRNHSILFWLISILLISVPPVWLMIRQKNYSMMGFYLGGIAALGTSLFIPTIQPRSILILLFPLYVVITWLLAQGWTDLKTQYLSRSILLLLVVLAAFNFNKILTGYQKNSPIQIQNQQTLILAAKNIQEGVETKEIHLSRLMDDNYAGKMPYEPNFEYIEYWLKTYYQIPQSVVLVWDQ